MHSLAQSISNAVFLGFCVGIPCYGYIKKVRVYDSFIIGAREGLNIAIKIIPYLVAMIVAIGMFRAAGGFDLLGSWLAPLLSMLGIPQEILPLALMRPFSGSASNGMLAELIQTHGPDSMIAHIGATLMGSTETTFYVIAVYFGAVGIRRTRHAVPVGLIADVVGVMAAVIICKILL